MSRHLKVALGAALALALGVPAAAAADDTTTSGTVTGDTLAFSAPASASWAAGITLDGTDHTATFSVPLSVNDRRGTGAGWNVTVTSTSFANADGKKLAADAASMTGVTQACATGTCTDATNAVGYPLPVPAGDTAPTASKFFNAAADSGMGNFTVTPAVSVSVPANVYQGTYSSTVTVAAATGP
jgi:hypothetical protein